MGNLLEMVLLHRMFSITPPAHVTSTCHLWQKRAPWTPEAPCTWEYQAVYRIKQIFYSNDRSIGCSSMLPAGASRLLDPIHGRGISQRSNISSNLKGSMRSMLPAGGKRGDYFLSFFFFFWILILLYFWRAISDL